MRLSQRIGTIVISAAALVLSACGGGSQTTSFSQTETPEEHAQYAEMFRASARAYSVPLGLLEAIAYVETRWHPAHPDPADAANHGHMQVYGIMGFHDDSSLGHGLKAAAEAIGKDPSELTVSSALNIEGAAALLKQIARKKGVEDSDLARWSEVVRAFSGIPELEDSDTYVTTVFKTLRDGVAENGIEIPAHPGLMIPAPKAPASKDPLLDNSGGTSSSVKPKVTWAPSPNYSKNTGRKPKYVVIHVTEGSFSSAVSWLRSSASKASAHYVVQSSDGAIKQLVNDEDQAWHARCWNAESIGIEHEGFIARPEKYFTDVMYRSSANLVRYLTEKFSIPRSNVRIVGHNVGDTSFIQKTGLVDCNTHDDPGPGWNWFKYFAIITGTSSLL
jgi:hypothetical protein